MKDNISIQNDNPHHTQGIKKHQPWRHKKAENHKETDYASLT